MRAPSFNLRIPKDADAAVSWVRNTSTALGNEIYDPAYEGPVTAYPQLIESVIDASVGGGAEEDALGFVSAACRAGEGVYAEFVHDLILLTESKVGDNYGRLISDIFDAACEGKSFTRPITAYVPRTPEEWKANFLPCGEDFMRDIARADIEATVRKIVHFHSQTIGKGDAIASARQAIQDYEDGDKYYSAPV